MEISVTKSIGVKSKALEPCQREKDQTRWFEGKVLSLVKELKEWEKENEQLHGERLDRVEKQKNRKLNKRGRKC